MPIDALTEVLGSTMVTVNEKICREERNDDSSRKFWFGERSPRVTLAGRLALCGLVYSVDDLIG